MDVEIPHPNGTTYSSLLSPADFHEHVKGLSRGAQLQFCTSVFEANNIVRERSHHMVYQAWLYIEKHALWTLDQKTQAEYWEEVNKKYEIDTIVESERRKQKARRNIQNSWRISLEDCLGERVPVDPGRNLLELLAQFAKLCNDVSTATRLLEGRIENRPPRSRRTDQIIAQDVQDAIEKWREQQEKEVSTRRKEQRYSGQAGTSKRKRRTAQSSRKRKVPKHSQLPDESPTNEVSDDSSELSDYRSSVCEGSDDEIGVEIGSYEQVFQQSLPFTPHNFQEKLRDEVSRLRQEVPSETWGATITEQTHQLLMTAKPVTVFVPGVPEGIRYGLYKTASRQNADVLSLADEDASEALAEGPSDGKPVLIRNSHDRRDLTAQEFLTAIERYCISDLDVQDPTISFTKPDSCRNMAPADLTAKFREVLCGEKTIGYADNKIPPYNCLSLPSMSTNEPQCLTRTEALQLDHLLRIWNPSTDATTDRLSWSTLSMHLAISPSHQDHDGRGTLSHPLFGYKVWLFWPRMSDTYRSKFMERGMLFSGRGARFLVLAPGDQFIQTPCVSQDVHSVISLGYCGVSECIEDCLNSGYPRCCGVVGAFGDHYRHAHYTADSVNSARNELESGIISNEARDPHFTQWLDQVEELANRDENVLGGSDACTKFREAKQRYLETLER